MMVQPTTQTTTQNSLQSYIKPAALATGALTTAKLVAETVGPLGVFSNMENLPCVSCDHILSMMPTIVSSHPILASTVAVGTMISSAAYCYKDEIKHFIVKRQIMKGLETQIADPAERARAADQAIEGIKMIQQMVKNQMPVEVQSDSSRDEAPKTEASNSEEKNAEKDTVEKNAEEKKPDSTRMNLRPRREGINYRELGGVRTR